MPKHAFIPTISSDHRPPKESDASSLCHRRDRPEHRSFALAATESLCFRFPPTPSNPRSRSHPCDLTVSRQPARVASPSSSRVADLPAIFHAGSSMGTLPSEASLHSCRRVLSDSTVPPAVCHLAVLRLRGFERPSLTCTLRCTAHCERMRSLSETFSHLTTGRSSLGRFPPSRMTSRPRSTLLRNSSHGLQSFTCALWSPLRVASSPHERALFRVSKNRKN
jgi:hypothetical protein